MTVPAFCHILDAGGSPICGAELRGTRPLHPLELCEHDGHEQCLVCEEMQDLDRWEEIPRAESDPKPL